MFSQEEINQIEKICRRVMISLNGIDSLELSKTTKDPEILDVLSRDEDSDVRCRVALNHNTKPETLDVLSRDENYHVRCYVALNPYTKQETLDVLSRDEDWSIRCRVARNRNTSPETLDGLSHDENSDVRWRVTLNPNYKKDITIKLSAFQHEALKKLIASSQDPELRNVTL